MTDLQLQTTPEHWAELARLAEGDVRLAKAHHLQAITALLADRDALEAECQRLRERYASENVRAVVAEKAVECLARLSDTEGTEGSGEWYAWAFEQARAALGVAPEPQ